MYIEQKKRNREMIIIFNLVKAEERKGTQRNLFQNRLIRPCRHQRVSPGGINKL